MPRFLSTRLICGLICPQMSLFNSEGKPQVELEIIQRRQMRVRDNEGTRGGNGAADYVMNVFTPGLHTQGSSGPPFVCWDE